VCCVRFSCAISASYTAVWWFLEPAAVVPVVHCIQASDQHENPSHDAKPHQTEVTALVLTCAALMTCDVQRCGAFAGTSAWGAQVRQQLVVLTRWQRLGSCPPAPAVPVVWCHYSHQPKRTQQQQQQQEEEGLRRTAPHLVMTAGPPCTSWALLAAASDAPSQGWACASVAALDSPRTVMMRRRQLLVCQLIAHTRLWMPPQQLQCRLAHLPAQAAAAAAAAAAVRAAPAAPAAPAAAGVALQAAAALALQGVF
jgi:hypothetical protein